MNHGIPWRIGGRMGVGQQNHKPPNSSSLFFQGRETEDPTQAFLEARGTKRKTFFGQTRWGGTAASEQQFVRHFADDNPQ